MHGCLGAGDPLSVRFGQRLKSLWVGVLPGFFRHREGAQTRPPPGAVRAPKFRNSAAFLSKEMSKLSARRLSSGLVRWRSGSSPLMRRQESWISAREQV